MSEGVLASLQRSNPSGIFNHLNHVIHNRSDYFIDSFLDKTQISVSKEDVFDADCDSSPNFPNISLINELSFYIDNQSIDRIGINRSVGRKSLFDNISNHDIDVIIVDNFMDIASKLVYDRLNNKSFFIHSAAYSPTLFSKRFFYTDFLPANISLLNQKKILSWLSFMQPKSKIYFVPFPRVVYGNESKDSVFRANQFQELISNANISTPILSVRNVGEHDLLSASDWAHYSPKFYDSIASQITV
jgi:hypothetical protein